jgi:hypothetical protein
MSSPSAFVRGTFVGGTPALLPLPSVTRKRARVAHGTRRVRHKTFRILR